MVKQWKWLHSVRAQDAYRAFLEDAGLSDTEERERAFGVAYRAGYERGLNLSIDRIRMAIDGVKEMLPSE